MKSDELLSKLKENLKDLQELLDQVCAHWAMEDCIYRYYHGSFKVYHIQSETYKIVRMLTDLAPEGCVLCESFMDIIKQGVGKKFSSRHNNNWGKHTRPLLEAFFHARYFLEMAVKYAKELDRSPEVLPSGWAALLTLYGLRYE